MKITVKQLVRVGALITVPVTLGVTVKYAPTVVRNYIKHEVRQEVAESLPLVASPLREWRGEAVPEGLPLFEIDHADSARVDSLVAVYRGQAEDGVNFDTKRGGRWR